MRWRRRPIVPQTVTGREPAAQFLVSAGQIEQTTHLDFLHDLPDEQERLRRR